MYSRPVVDVVIQTFNEEVNLPHTLASVKGLAENVFIVDSGSTDRTREIAEEAGATFVHHDWEGYARQKNWALKHLPFESDWTLILDADEALLPELADEIRAIVGQDPDDVEESGFYLNRIFVFDGKRIRHSGYFPSWNLRLFKTGQARYDDRLVHEHMSVRDGNVGYLEHVMLHEDRRGLEHFFAKHNRYSTLEAQQMILETEPWPGVRGFLTNRIKRVRFIKNRVLPILPVAWAARFFYMYVLRLGFLDGRAGFSLSSAIAFYEYQVQAKFRELKRLGEGHDYVHGLAVDEGTPVQQLVAETSKAAQDGTHLSADGSGDEPVTKPLRRRRGRQVETRTDVAQLGDTDVPIQSPWSLGDKVRRVLWMFTQATIFRYSFHNWYGLRRLILRAFGAKLGEGVRVRPTVHIEIPWNLEIGDHSIVGDEAILYALGKVTVGRRVVISQYAHLCAGTHDFNDPNFPLIRPPVVVEDEAWIAADAFVGPGVTVGRRAIVGARASAFKDVPAGKIAGGNPAKPLRDRDPAPAAEGAAAEEAEAAA